jgi:hypothetical protein
MDYVKLFEDYQNYSEYDKVGLDYESLESDLNTAIFAAYKIKTGKKTAKYIKASQELGDDLIKQIIEPFQAEMMRRVNERRAVKEGMETTLTNYAKKTTIAISDISYCLKSANGGDYHTQGYGASRYAKASLEDDFLLLDLWGYSPEIREVSNHYDDRWGVNYIQYELWARITPFDFWMLKHSGIFISVLNWAVLCWRKGTNPKVYFPFLSDDDYEKSLALNNIHNYQITKENCRLELTWDQIKGL